MTALDVEHAVAPPRDPASFSPLERWLATFPPELRQQAHDQFWRGLSAYDRRIMQFRWYSLLARPHQRLPRGSWDTWVIRAGRGFGKTRTGSEAVRRLVERQRARLITIIGPTAADARDVMIEGPDSGLLAVHPDDTRPLYESSKRKLTWPNGAIGHIRSAEEPDGVRGLNSDLVWGDEPASWKTGSAAWDNAQLGNRVGSHPRAILTGTPRRVAWMQDLEAQPGTVTYTGSTYENIGNLAEPFIRLILGRYEGTRLGRQELHAMYLDDVEGALWRMAVIEATRFTAFDTADPARSFRAQIDAARLKLGLGVSQVIPLDRRPWRTIVAVDPPGETAECGISVGAAPKGGVQGRDHAVILADESLAGPPEVWGPAVVAAFRYWRAEAVFVEANQGGDMCRSTIHAVDRDVPVKKIRAKESKKARAEPIAALHSKGWLHFVGILPKLEDQLTTWVPGESRSPDRLDAFVHAVRELLSDVEVPASRVLSPLRSTQRIN